jgi:hypothetical protein
MTTKEGGLIWIKELPTNGENTRYKILWKTQKKNIMKTL